jgi:malonyl-CoA O-methyltransferase
MKAKNLSTSIRTRFSASASTYEENARFQKMIANELITFIPREIKPSILLEIGCGTGLLTRLLIKLFPDSKIHALDLSAAMIAQNKTRLPSHIQWHIADILHFKSEIQFPLVVSNCALHWLESIPEGFRNIYHLIQPGGSLVISIMIDGTLAELHEARKKIAPNKIPPGRLPKINEVLDHLKKINFNIYHFEEKTHRMSYPTVSSFLRVLHDTGVTSGAISQAHQPLNRTELNRLIESYETSYSDAGQGVRATYRTLFIVAERT